MLVGKLLFFLFLLYKATPNFTIFYEPQDTRTAQEILKFAETEFPRISKDLGMESQPVIMSDPELVSGEESPTKINIHLLSSTSEIKKINEFPDWGIGCAIPNKHTIILKSPRIVKYPVNLKTLVAHEISHIVLGNITQIKIPKWFDEGVAMFESCEWELGESIWLSWATFTHSILPLSSIELYFPDDSKKAKLAYVESFSTISFIIDQFGEVALYEIIQTLAKGETPSITKHSSAEGYPQNFDQVLEKVLLLNSLDFSNEWKKWVEQKYTGFNVLFNTFFPSGLLLFIFFLAIFLKKRKIKSDNVKSFEPQINTDEHKDRVLR